MISIEGIGSNFKFLALEVANQARATREFLHAPSAEAYDKIVSRDDYIDNLKNIIENKCFSKIHTEDELAKRTVNEIRAIQISCVNLERIADFCVNVVKQMGYLKDHRFLLRFDPDRMFDIIDEGLALVLPVQQKNDLAGALKICRTEPDLDRLYKDTFDRIMSELRIGLKVEELITVLFIFRYLERIGDSLLNIGEAMIFALIGEKIKIEQFQALQQTLSKSGYKGDISDIDFKGIWGSRSGCRIGKVEAKEEPANAAHGSIFKEGALRKIRREKENIVSWEGIRPGLGPKIFSYHEEDDKASMLVEFLPGCTLEELELTGDEEVFQNAYFILEQILEEVWETTLVAAPIPTDYVAQLRSRLGSIQQVHPGFFRRGLKVGAAEVLSTEALFDAAEVMERELPAPFSVFIHGDFNMNNVVYDHADQSVHFIDLYRSRRADLVQDVSVFMVSNFRLPVFEENLRQRLRATSQQFYEFAQAFAVRHGDATFQARLTLGLARSFFTSTRFELQHEFAEEMYLRANYLLEKLLAHRGRPWEAFELPMQVLDY
ncbi:MAG: PhoU domain-containing protein [Desulfovibrionaceae bacterium]